MNGKQCLSRQEVPGQFIASTLRMVHCKVDCFKMNSLFITSPLWRSSPDFLIVGVQEKEAETGKPAKCDTWPEYKYLSARSRSCHRQRRNPRRSEVCFSQRLGSPHAQEVTPRCKKWFSQCSLSEIASVYLLWMFYSGFFWHFEKKLKAKITRADFSGN